MSSFSTQLAAAEQYASCVLQPILTGAEARVAALEAELSAARAERDRAAAALAEVTERITDLRVKAEQASSSPKGSFWARINHDVPAEEYLAPATSGRIWSVSDCHSHFGKGVWAREATESSSYGVCVTPSDTEDANVSITLFNGESALVSKKRLQAMKDIRVGDTLYMGDKSRSAVFKGTVTGQSVKGLFRSADSSVDSFRRRVGERAAAVKSSTQDVSPLSSEVEMMWDVKWECVGGLTDSAKTALRFSERRTVRPLSAHPSF